MPAKKTPQDYHNLAMSRGFKWLGPEPSDCRAKTNWECPHGHSFTMDYSHVQRGQNCQICVSRKRVTPEDFYAIAKKQGIEWLGPEVKNGHTKTRWRCLDGHSFEMAYNSVQQGRGCRICGRKKAATKNRTPTENYHTIAKEREFTWLGPEVPNIHTKTKWMCSFGHIFEMPYSDIQGGHGCRFCGREQANSKTRTSIQEYHALASKSGLVWCDTELPKNVRCKTKWLCPNGHVYAASFRAMSITRGCPQCRNLHGGQNRSSTKNFIRSAKEVHGDKFDYSKVEYQKSTIEVEIICAKHGGFWQKPANHLQGYGCPYCSQSKGEEQIAKDLTSWGIHFTRQKKFDACKDKRCLPFDFFFQIGKVKFLVECDGKQHFEPIEAWGGDDNFEQIQHRDAIKTRFAEKHGFVLVRIPAKPVDKIPTLLREAIEQYIKQPLRKPGLNLV